MSFTERFTGHAAAYVVARPSYPMIAVDVMLSGLGAREALRVADIGAGTGISSRLIASRGPLVYAVEPNAAMRKAASPDERVRWVDGTAEATTLPAASVDCVCAFQAWHWVEHAAGVAEARRIARPGGRLAVVYNERDERDPFTAGYGEIVRRYAQDDTEGRRAAALANVAAVDPSRTHRFSFPHVQSLDRAGVHKRAESSSYLPQSGAKAVAMHADIDALVERFAPGGSVGMALLALVVRVDL